MQSAVPKNSTFWEFYKLAIDRQLNSFFDTYNYIRKYSV